MELRRRSSLALLVCTVLVAIALASYWAIRVPFFQEPDELAHADYVFELVDAGGPFVVHEARPQLIVTPQERYLARAVAYRQNRYTAWGPLPQGYGSRAYFRQVDRDAPKFERHVPAAGSVVPRVMFSYPCGYYVLAASLMDIVALVHPGSLTTQLFAVRFIGVACLPVMLFLAYATFRRLFVPRVTALLATIAIGLLPLTSWVFAYVQPDVLTTTLITAALYACINWKRSPEAKKWPILLCVLLISLAFVKQHFAAATWCATLLAALSASGALRRWRLLAGVFVPPLLAMVVALTLGPAGPIGLPHLPAQSSSAHASIAERVADVASFALLGAADAFGGGDAFGDFWLKFGFRGASIFRGEAAAVIRFVLIFCTLAVAALFALRQYLVWRKIARVSRKRSRALALRLLAGDVVINLYCGMTAILLFVYAISGGSVWLEGRYWLPVIVPLLAIVVARIPRLLQASRRAPAAVALAAIWAAYAIVAAPFGVLAVDRAFYQPRAAPPALEPFAGILAVKPAAGCQASPQTDATSAIHRGCAIRVEGYAIDGERGLPATTVFITIDGHRFVRTLTGRPSPQIGNVYNDDALQRSGIVAVVDTSRLLPGMHEIGLSIVERRAPRGLPAPGDVSVNVVR